jgi:hypothetical protein
MMQIVHYRPFCTRQHPINRPEKKMKYQIYRRVNPNAHNVRYGRDCRAPAVLCGEVEACDEHAAQAEAERLGMVYNPDMGEYEWLFDRAVAA